MTAILFVFLPNLYSVIERLQYALAWFGVLIAVGLWVGRNKAYAKLHRFLESAYTSVGYKIFGSATPASKVQEIEK
jgi:hypothetical protein